MIIHLFIVLKLLIKTIWVRELYSSSGVSCFVIIFIRQWNFSNKFFDGSPVIVFWVHWRRTLVWSLNLFSTIKVATFLGSVIIFARFGYMPLFIISRFKYYFYINMRLLYLLPWLLKFCRRCFRIILIIHCVLATLECVLATLEFFRL